MRERGTEEGWEKKWERDGNIEKEMSNMREKKRNLGWLY
jgi:hypothetical protein